MTDHPYYHRQTIDTVVHEGRHAYQHYNVEVRTVHESDAEVASWRENFLIQNMDITSLVGKKSTFR